MNPLHNFNERMRSLTDKANLYLKQRGFQVAQRNGQRISVISWMDSEVDVAQQNEVFVGKIPRDLFEDELLPVMERAGRVFKMRLMMDFSGTNRGFGFVKYMTREEAALACSLLNETLIRPDAPPIGVLPSFDNKKLFFGNLPAKCTREKLLADLKQILTDVEDVKMSDCAPNSDRRFAFVTFKSHEAATQARRLLVPGNVKLFNRILTVDWAKPSKPANFPDLNNNYNSNHLAFNENNSLTPSGSNTDSSLSSIDLLKPIDPANVITICNIKPGIADLNQLKRIFELADRLKIVDIQSTGPGSITIAYESKEHADLMLESLVLLSCCFDKLAVPNQALLAYRSYMQYDQFGARPTLI